MQLRTTSVAFNTHKTKKNIVGNTVKGTPTEPYAESRPQSFSEKHSIKLEPVIRLAAWDSGPTLYFVAVKKLAL